MNKRFGFGPLAPPKAARCHGFLLLWLAVLLYGTDLPAAQSSSEPSALVELDRIVTAPKYKGARWGFLVADLKSGDVLYERDADKLFAPASTTKLYTVAAALDVFGADYRFETPVYARGAIDDQGRLEGDLILVASGDLTMGGRTDADGHIVYLNTDHTYANGNTTSAWTVPDPLAGLNALAQQVVAAGVKRVSGQVLIDDRLFEHSESSGTGPTRVTPIMINDNLIDVLITPTLPGTPPTVRWRPESALITVESKAETVATNKPITVWVQGASGGRVIVRGGIPAGHSPVLRVTEMVDPERVARGLFIEALARAGVTVADSSSNRPPTLPPRSQYASLQKVALFQSPPFREEIKLILKVSHNLHASSLPLLLAAKASKRTLADGLQAERTFLARMEVDVDSISFGGGAGGTRVDFTTPRATVQLLRSMMKHPDADAYRAAMPVLGVDGTLSAAVDRKSPARGNVWAKTGTLFYDNLLNGNALLASKALAGYMQTSHKRDLAFAIYVNNVPLDSSSDPVKEGQVLGRLTELLYEAF